MHFLCLFRPKLVDNPPNSNSNRASVPGYTPRRQCRPQQPIRRFLRMLDFFHCLDFRVRERRVAGQLTFCSTIRIRLDLVLQLSFHPSLGRPVLAGASKI